MTPTLIAQLLAIAAASGTRASLTLAVLAVASRFTGFDLPGELAFLSTDVGLGLLAALVVLDEMVERDPDLQGPLALAGIAVRGASGAVAAWSLEDSLGGTLPDPAVWAIGAGVAAGVHLLRTQVQAYLPSGGDGWLDPRTWLGWLEVGGVLGILVAVFLAPFIALGFVVLATMVAVVGFVFARQLDKTRRRRPCTSCGHAVRVEASRCPRCKNEVPIAQWLAAGQPSPRG